MNLSGFAELAVQAFSAQTLNKIVFSKPDTPDVRKIVCRPCIHRQNRLLVMESYLPGDTVSQRNVKEEDIFRALEEQMPRFAQIHLLCTVGEAQYKRAASGKEVFLGADRLARRMQQGAAALPADLLPLDRQKSYILQGNEPFLIRLGISDKTGRPHDKMQGKFRQINRFLEYVRDVYDALPADGTLHLYDLCCGKSYLSFALYHYLCVTQGRTLDMLCADLKEDVLITCGAIARDLGFGGMRFLCRDITDLPAAAHDVDMVVSLHACDTATDVVLRTAASLRARVILCTPCCQRHLRTCLCAPELDFVSRYAHLSEKLCATLTDALRLSYLRAEGYRVSAPELTDPADTPKNTLIRAVRTRTRGTEEDKKEYRDILRFLFGENASAYLKGAGYEP